MTGTTTTTTTPPGHGATLHRALHRELRLLAEAGRVPIEGRRAQLWDEQVAMVLEALDHHLHADGMAHAAMAAGCEDLSRPVRSTYLARLHDLSDPGHHGAEDWDALVALLLGTPRRRLPLVLSWLASAAGPHGREHLLSALPPLVRAQLRRVWWPRYARRVRALYGPEPAAALLAAERPAVAPCTA